MKKLFKVLAALLACLLVLTACGGNSEETGTDSDTEYDESKVLTIALNDTMIKGWDPATTYGDDARIYINVYELLYYRNTDGTYTPWLATDYEVNDDATEWTFTLREGVKFHDGTDFTAESVKKAIDRTVALDMGASFLWAPLDHIEVVDDTHVKFVLANATDLMPIVSCQYAAYIYSWSEGGDDLQASQDWFNSQHECGTGPYTISEFSDGSHCILKKFDEYWGGWEGNHIETVVYRQNNESSIRRQMVEGNEADIALELYVNDAEEAKNNPDVKVLKIEGAGNTLAFFNVENGPTKEKLVRQGLAYSFPYQDVIDYVYSGEYASIPVDMICQANQNFVTDSIPYTYDLEKARALFDEAGYTGAFTVTVSYNSSAENTKKQLELWKSELAKIDVELSIEPNAYELAMSRATSTDPTERADIYIQETVCDTYTAYSSYVSSGGTGGGWNFSGFGRADLDALYEEANIASVFDAEKGKELFNKAGEILIDECACLNLHDNHSTILTNNKVSNVDLNPGYVYAVRAYNVVKSN